MDEAETYANLRFELQDLTSILALVIRDRMGNLAKFADAYPKLQDKLDALYEKLNDATEWLSADELSGIKQQITIAQTLIQAAQILGIYAQSKLEHNLIHDLNCQEDWTIHWYPIGEKMYPRGPNHRR